MESTLTVPVEDPSGTLARIESLRQQHPRLTLNQLTVLLLIDRGADRVTRLADRLGVSTPTITGMVDRLVAAHLVLRESEQGDRRVHRLVLSRQGHAVLALLTGAAGASSSTG